MERIESQFSLLLYFKRRKKQETQKAAFVIWFLVECVCESDGRRNNINCLRAMNDVPNLFYFVSSIFFLFIVFDKKIIECHRNKINRFLCRCVVAGAAKIHTFEHCFHVILYTTISMKSDWMTKFSSKFETWLLSFSAIVFLFFMCNDTISGLRIEFLSKQRSQSIEGTLVSIKQFWEVFSCGYIMFLTCSIN